MEIEKQAIITRVTGSKRGISPHQYGRSFYLWYLDETWAGLGRMRCFVDRAPLNTIGGCFWDIQNNMQSFE